MAGFLRKKSKQVPPTKPPTGQIPPTPSSPPSTPLFARFATTSPTVSEPQRLVSSPMLLSKREPASAHMNRTGSRLVSSGAPKAAHSRRDVEVRTPRNQPYMPERTQETFNHDRREPQPATRHSPTQPRASRVPMVDKPLPLTYEPDHFNANVPTHVTLPAATRPASQDLSPIEGEYAHLWSVIAGDDKPLPEAAEPTFNPNPVPVPRKKPVESDSSRYNHTPGINSSLPPRSTSLADPNTLPSGASKATLHIPSSSHRTAVDNNTDHDFRPQTLTPRPSNHSSPRQGFVTPVNGPPSDLGASAGRTVSSSTELPHDGWPGDVFGTQPGNERLSNYYTSHMQDIDSPEVQESNPAFLPSPSSLPKTNRKLTKPKARVAQSADAHSRLSAALDDSNAYFAQPLPPPKPANNMGVNTSSLEIHTLQPSFKDLRSQTTPVNNQHHKVSSQLPLPPPPPLSQSPQPQQYRMSHTPTFPPQGSASISPPPPTHSTQSQQNRMSYAPTPSPQMFSSMPPSQPPAHSPQPQQHRMSYAPMFPSQPSSSVPPLPTHSPQPQQHHVPYASTFPSQTSSNAPPPPPAHPTQPQQRRMSVASTSPRKSPSIRSTNAPAVTGKPLIFAAMASVGQEGPRAPSRLPVTDPPVSQIRAWSNLPPTPPQAYTPPPQAYPSPPQMHPSPPNEFSFPTSSESLPRTSNHHPLPRPPQTVANNINRLGDTRPMSDHQQDLPMPASLPSRDILPPHLGAPRASFAPDEQASQQSPPRTKRPSKRGKSSSDISAHSHSSVNGVHHRTPVKHRPTAPIPPSQAGPIQVDGEALGVSLDEDPFAKAEVKMLNPVSRSSSPSKDGHKAKQGSHSASEGGYQSDSQMLDVKTSTINAPPSPVMPERHLAQQHHGKAMTPEAFTPPVISAAEDAREHMSGYLANPQLLSTLLGFLSFYDWCILLSLSREIRFMLVQNQILRETVLERFLKTVGYVRWGWNEIDPISLSLQDLNDYMRGVSTPTHEYARVAALYIHSLSIHPSHRDQSLYETVHYLAASTRAYTRVVLRLRAQAEKEASVARARGNRGSMRGGGGSRPPSRAPSPTASYVTHTNHSNLSHISVQTQQPASRVGTTGTFQSPLFRLRRAPLLRVFVPSPDGDWLSDKSVLECEAECKRAGITNMMRVGDVVWDVAVGDEGNIGRLVWDGSYLIDLDYTYSSIGDLPKYMPTLAFPPSYFHRVIRTGPSSSNPIVHIDLRPWGEEIATNLQLLQDRVRTETPQGAYHNVVRWVHRSSFMVRPLVRTAIRAQSQYNNQRSTPQLTSPRIPIPDSNNLFVDPGWYGTIIVEAEGTNEALADLQDRCGPGVFPPRPQGVNGYQGSAMDRESKTVFRILREKSRPGEIWIRVVSAKERLL